MYVWSSGSWNALAFWYVSSIDTYTSSAHSTDISTNNWSKSYPPYWAGFLLVLPFTKINMCIYHLPILYKQMQQNLSILKLIQNVAQAYMKFFYQTNQYFMQYSLGRTYDTFCILGCDWSNWLIWLTNLKGILGIEWT